MMAYVYFKIILISSIFHFLILYPTLLLITKHYDLISIYVGPQRFSFFLFPFLVILFGLGKIDIINHHLQAQDLLFLLELLLHFYLKYETRFIHVFIKAKLGLFYLETLPFVFHLKCHY